MVEFFDKLRKGFDKGVTTVSVRSKEMLETTQLRTQVKTLQDERQRGLEELGSIVYTLHLQGKLNEGLERVQAKCETVATLDQKIREKEAEIRQTHRKAQEALGGGELRILGECSCGTAIHEGTKFCRTCGRPVEELGTRAEGTQDPGAIRCPQCDALLAVTARFCGNCGARIGAESV